MTPGLLDTSVPKRSALRRLAGKLGAENIGLLLALVAVVVSLRRLCRRGSLSRRDLRVRSPFSCPNWAC